MRSIHRTAALPHFALVVAVAASLTFTAAGAASAKAAPAQPPESSAGGTTRTVMLVTGDEVTLTTAPNGTTSDTIDPAPGSQGYTTYQASGGDRYVIPALAMPYLDQLNMSLFDVSALARDNSDTPTRLSVTLSYAPGVAPTAPAGFTLTSAEGSSATGYLTRASAPAFTADLRARIDADVAAGHRAGTTPLAADITQPGVTRVNAVERPHFPLHILQINTVDLTSAPAQAAVALMNTDSAGEQNIDLLPVGGVIRIAVPAGHYTAMAVYDDLNAQGGLTDSRQVIDDDFVVSDSATTTSVTLDERTATIPVSAVSPKPAVEDMLSDSVTRSDAAGLGLNAIYDETVAGIPLYVNAVAKPAVGSLHYVVDWSGAAQSTTDNYRVDLAFTADQVPADESFVGKASQLATIRDAIYADPASANEPAALASAAMDPTLQAHGLGTSVSTLPVPADAVITDYVGTADTGGWTQDEASATEQYLSSQPNYYRSGQIATVDFARGPVVPGLGHSATTFCEACSSGGTVLLDIPAVKDSAGHTGLVFNQAPNNYTLYRDNTVVADLNNVYFESPVNVPRTPATLRAVFTVDQSAVPGVSQNVKTVTEQTVQYDPAATGSTLPGSDTCDQDAALTPCQILSAITVDYDLAGAGLTNTVKPGPQVFGLDVGHVSYGGVGSHSPITSATVSVSFDDGTSWQPASVVGTRGHYVALWSNPSSAAGTSPSLKVTAQDAAGDAFSQTISNAYTIG